MTHFLASFPDPHPSLAKLSKSLRMRLTLLMITHSARTWKNAVCGNNKTCSLVSRLRALFFFWFVCVCVFSALLFLLLCITAMKWISPGNGNQVRETVEGGLRMNPACTFPTWDSVGILAVTTLGFSPLLRSDYSWMEWSDMLHVCMFNCVQVCPVFHLPTVQCWFQEQGSECSGLR